MKLRFDIKSVTLATLLLTCLMGHGHGGCCSDGVLGPKTGTECPPASTLTYQNFGKPFMDGYCVRCHDSRIPLSQRMGATADHDFETQIGVQSFSDHVDQAAGVGPNAANEFMPPNGDKPSRAEREMLAEWIACGAP